METMILKSVEVFFRDGLLGVKQYMDSMNEPVTLILSKRNLDDLVEFYNEQSEKAR